MTKRRSSQRTSTGGLGLLLIVALVGAFLVLRSDPAMASKLPPPVSTAIKSIPLPTGIPDIQLPTSGAPVTSGPAQFGSQTKTSGCQVVNGMPDSACTPGAIFPNATPDQICTPGYASGVRDVSSSEKEQAYTEYGLASHATGEYEVDHLVSLELGGSNDISNLWPEAASPSPGFHEKDKVEDYLHAQVCNGAMSLEEAQKEIASNWEVVYNQLPK